MKVVINAYSARVGGGQTYLKNIILNIPLFLDIELIVFAPNNFKLPQHPSVRRASTYWPTTNPLARVFWEKFILPFFLRKEKVDILFCPGGVVATKVPSSCKVVTMFRNMIPFDDALVSRMPWGPNKLRNLILKRVLISSMASADLTIFISQYAREMIEKRVDIPNPITIPHGISNDFRTNGQNLRLPQGAPTGKYLLYVSRFDSYKHHYQVVRAFAALPKELSEGLSMVFIGETNLPNADSIISLVEELGLKDKVIMTGAIPYSSLPAWYNNAYAIIFASSCENCPNILLESMASGRPIMSSNIMPMPEFGGDGLAYFSPFDTRDIIRVMTEVLTNNQYARDVAEAALSNISKYDWKETALVTWTQIIELNKGHSTGNICDA